MPIKLLCIVCQDQIRAGDFCATCRDQYAGEDAAWLVAARETERDRRNGERRQARQIDDPTPAEVNALTGDPDWRLAMEEYIAVSSVGVDLPPGSLQHFWQAFDDLEQVIAEMAGDARYALTGKEKLALYLQNTIDVKLTISAVAEKLPPAAILERRLSHSEFGDNFIRFARKFGIVKPNWTADARTVRNIRSIAYGKIAQWKKYRATLS